MPARHGLPDRVVVIGRLIAKFRRGCRHRDVEGIAWLDHTDLRLVVCKGCGLAIIEHA
jgi:hypothetical protein